MQFEQTDIPEVIVLIPDVHGDKRGFFMETYRENLFAEAGIAASFVQDNHSGSRQGILRGLHYQIRHAQGKLLRVVSGEIFDAAVDLRKKSPTFGHAVSVNISADNKKQIWIPPGFAHGFYVLSEWAEVIYRTTDYYAPEWERCLLWSDPVLGIEWPLINGQPPILSPRDSKGKLLREAEVYLQDA